MLKQGMIERFRKAVPIIREFVDDLAWILQSWAKVLKDDSNELYRAASKAQEVGDYIEKNMLLKGLEQVAPKALENGKEVPILSEKVKESAKVSPFQEIADRAMEKKKQQQKKRKLQVSVKDKPKQAELAR